MSLPKSTITTALSGALTIVIVWVLKIYHVDTPPEVAAAFTTIAATLTAHFTDDNENSL